MAGSQTPLLVRRRQASEYTPVDPGRRRAIGAVTAGVLLCGVFLLSRPEAWEHVSLARALKAGVLDDVDGVDGVDVKVFFKEEKGTEAIFASNGRKAAKAPVFAGQVLAMLNSADLGYAVEWPSGFRSVTGAASQQFSFPKYVPGGTSGGLGAPLSDWATDGTQPLRSGDTVAWYHPAANQVYDCAGSRCSLQAFPLPNGHWGSPDRIYLLDGGAGDPIHGGDKVYFDRMNGGTFSPGASLRATNGGTIGGVGMASRTVFVIKPPEPVDCAGAWSKWTTCSATCGGGTSTRVYVVTTSPQNGGKECPLSAKETNSCALDACPVDCIGYWGAWSECSVECAIGTQTRAYNISREAQHGGKHCPEKFKSQTKSCDTGVMCPPRNSKGDICTGISPWPLSSGCELRECDVVCQCTHPDKCTFPCECTGRETTTAIPTTTTTAAVPNTTSTPGATCNDGLMSGAEIGVDCGGPICPACVTTTAAPAATCSDGLMNGAETWTDCGGGICPACVTTTAAPAAKVAEEILLESQSSWSADLELLETEQAELASNAQLVRVMTLDATNKEKCTFCPLPSPVVLPAPSKVEVRTFVVGGKELAVLGLQHESENLRSADFAMTSTLRTDANGREVRSYEITQGEVISRYEPVGEALYER